MRKSLSLLLQIFLSIFGLSFFSATTSLAQITPDNTLDTQVNSDGKVSEITGGQTRGNNLFHSFQDFSIQNGNEAFFDNADNIANIFSRVTGGNVSTIDGLIRANGSASLFLINPNGIIFGEGAQLDIGGSFLGSTASSILFPNGEFNATDLDNPPLLKINAPIGLGLDDSPGEIVNRSIVQDTQENPVGLEVLAGNNLSLVGGKIEFEGGKATARGGKIELGGLSTAGTIGISEDGSLTFPQDVAKADITLSNGAKVDVRSTGGGNIAINSRNLNLTAREDSSLLRAGITKDSTSNDAQAGDIIINVAENLTLDDSRITNQVDADGVGNSGKIDITTGSLLAINGGDIDSSTSGQGNAGLVEITATENITFDGATPEGDRSGATSRVDSGGEGNAGGVTISANNLNLTNGGRINASTKGQGNAGLVKITATGDITFDGATLEGDRSGATSRVDSGGEGNAKGVIISTNNLTLKDGGRIDASTSGQGNAGFVDITATGDITFNGTTLEGDRSGVTSRVNKDGEGNVGDITILTTNLNLANGGRVDTASTRGTGDGGSINITATEDITLRNNSPIAAESSGNNNGGNININARFIIAFPNGNNDNQLGVEPGEEINFAIDADSQFGNDILASAEQGQGGNIAINAKSLFGIEERSLNASTNDINASSEFGLSGTVEIDILEVDPSQDSLNLPVETVKAEVAQTCERNISGNQSEFVVTGRGGLPTEPEDNFRLPALATTENDLKSETSAQQKSEVSPPIVEATTWVRNEQGKILLLASPANVSSLNSSSDSVNCNS